MRQARAILTRPEETVSSVARLLGVSRSTMYKYVPELTDSSDAGRMIAVAASRDTSRRL
ncbi:helix-turn-helix domain-containing protein [Nocardia sp. NPDC004260]